MIILGIYMSNVLNQYKMTKTNLMKNYLLNMTQSLHITEIYSLWQRNCTKLKINFRQKFWLKFLLKKKSLIII